MTAGERQKWSNKDNLTTTRYEEYNNDGEGANTSQRVEWSKQLNKKEAQAITIEKVLQ